MDEPTYNCLHDCCDQPHEPFHRHDFPPIDCPECLDIEAKAEEVREAYDKVVEAIEVDEHYQRTHAVNVATARVVKCAREFCYWFPSGLLLADRERAVALADAVEELNAEAERLLS